MRKITALIIFPSVLLQFVTYKLMGISATCRWGDMFSQPIGPVTKTQRNLSITIPVIIIAALVVTLRFSIEGL